MKFNKTLQNIPQKAKYEEQLKIEVLITAIDAKVLQAAGPVPDLGLSKSKKISVISM